MYTLPSPASIQTWVIGDVHGQNELLQEALEFAEHHTESHARFISLGDLIDRGPGSVAALDLMAKPSEKLEKITIAGNHEAFLTHILDAPVANNDHDDLFNNYYNWMRNGGAKMVEELDLVSTADEWLARKELIESLGSSRLEFISSMKPWFRDNNLLFIHAGIDPNKSLKENLDFDHRRVDYDMENPQWIRDEFLFHESPFPENVFVIHGHTIQEDGPDLRSNRLNLDVGAYSTNRLVMAEMNNSDLSFHEFTKN